MRASRSRTRNATNLLTSTPDEAALAIACALLTARDLPSLRLSCGLSGWWGKFVFINKFKMK